MHNPSRYSLAVAVFLLVPANASAQRTEAVGVARTSTVVMARASLRSMPTRLVQERLLPELRHPNYADSASGVPHGLIGAVSGAIVGASVGYRAARSDGRPPAVQVRQYVIAGTAIGAVAGYGLESLVRMLSR